MGTWGRSLFSNDFTCDIRDTYLEKLKESLDNEKAVKETIDKYSECLDTDEEPLFWYALAETLWKVGRLTDEVKSKALTWIVQEGGIEFWEDSKKDCEKWRNTLQKLSNLLNEPMPEEKKFRKTKPYVKNPWNVGDVYAYKFHKKESIANGLIDKYIVLQKIGDYDNDDYYCSKLQVFNKIFDEIPELDEINNVSLLPQVDPEFCVDVGDDVDRFQSKVYFNLRYELLSSRSYPKKYLSYIGNSENKYKHFPCYDDGLSMTFWEDLEGDFYNFYTRWKNYTYEINGENVTVMKK